MKEVSSHCRRSQNTKLIELASTRIVSCKIKLLKMMMGCRRRHHSTYEWECINCAHISHFFLWFAIEIVHRCRWDCIQNERYNDAHTQSLICLMCAFDCLQMQKIWIFCFTQRHRATATITTRTNLPKNYVELARNSIYNLQQMNEIESWENSLAFTQSQPEKKEGSFAFIDCFEIDCENVRILLKIQFSNFADIGRCDAKEVRLPKAFRILQIVAFEIRGTLHQR